MTSQETSPIGHVEVVGFSPRLEFGYFNQFGAFEFTVTSRVSHGPQLLRTRRPLLEGGDKTLLHLAKCLSSSRGGFSPES